jgi:hypothetical protein
MIEGIRKLKVHLAEEAISRYQHEQLNKEQFAIFVLNFTQHKDWSQEFIRQSYNLYFIKYKVRSNGKRPLLWVQSPLAGLVRKVMK